MTVALASKPTGVVTVTVTAVDSAGDSDQLFVKLSCTLCNACLFATHGLHNIAALGRHARKLTAYD